MKIHNDFIVDVDVLRTNALNIKKRIGNAKFCAVVKANAYGIGLHTVCKALMGIADFFAVANIKEAMYIRSFDKITKIIVLSPVDNDLIVYASKNDISVSISSLEHLSQIDCQITQPINIHLQVNTGLNRFGFRSIHEFKNALKIIDKNVNLNLEGVYSHFATKKEDIKFMNKQFLRFLQFKKCVTNDGVIFHLANSSGIIQSSKYHLDMVRSGFLLYGYAENNIGNRPVLKIVSRIINILDVKRGDSIGYDRAYFAEKNMRVGVVGLGYADGYNRRLSNNFFVLINGKKCPIVGNICMDCFMIKIDNDVRIGDEVVVLGRSKSESILIDDYAKVIGTSPYEVLCNFRYSRMNYIINSRANKNT